MVSDVNIIVWSSVFRGQLVRQSTMQTQWNLLTCGIIMLPNKLCFIRIIEEKKLHILPMIEDIL